MQAWSAEQDRKVAMIQDRLKDVPGLQLSVDPDPNGCPFSRVRLTPVAADGRHSTISLRDELASGNPSIVLRAHHIDEGYVNIDGIEMTDDEIEFTCRRIREFFTPR